MTEPAEYPTPGRAFWIGLAIGVPVIAFGVTGLLRATTFDAVKKIGVWVIGADLVHDVIIAPIVGLCALALARWVPRPWRAPLAAAMAASAIATVVAYPALRGFGRAHAAGNPSVQPLNYTTALLTVLAAIWAAAAIWTIAIAARRTHPHRRESTSSPSPAPSEP